MQKSLFQLFYINIFEFGVRTNPPHSVKNNHRVHFACAAAATHSFVPLVWVTRSDSAPLST